MWTESRTPNSGAKELPKNEIDGRREPRLAASLPVRVSGFDRDGNPFLQTAHTIDVSRNGARLEGVRCLRGAGEIVTIQCGAHSARFIVVWVGKPGSAEDGQFGVKALQPEKRIFRIDPAESHTAGSMRPSAQAASDPFAPPPVATEKWDHTERRSAPRIPCSGTGEIRQPGVAFPIWAQVADLSAGGCYVEMVFTIARGSHVDVQLTINTRSFAAKGKVVTSHPGVGVGIQFTELTQANQKTLSEILQDLTK